MPSPKDRIPLRGSERAPLPGARAVGAANPDEPIQVTIRLRRDPANSALQMEKLGTRPLKERQHLTRQEFAKQHGANSGDIEKIEVFAHEHRLAVVTADPARRTVILSGTVAAFSAAFDVELKQYEHPNGTYRGRTGPIHLPADLADVVEGVFGLDNRPQARPHFRRRKLAPGLMPHVTGGAFTPVQVAALYDFPPGDGSGQCIGIIELGGGYRPNDLQNYFQQLGLATPSIVAVSVDGGANQPDGNADGPDGEVMLDIEVAGGIAPAAQIVVYFAPNTDAGFLDAITTAIHDSQHQPSVISISWGSPEAAWTPQAMQSFDGAFQAAGSMGVAVCCASGDNGSSDGEQDGLSHADFPASSPNVLGCGGTHLEGSGNQITNETAWNDGLGGGATGGGISSMFDLPSWQNNAGVPPSANPDQRVGRGVPDVSADADPASGYEVMVDGQAGVIGGTSAVAPLYSGLIARINQQAGKSVGYLNPLLYAIPSSAGAFHDITQGDNGAYNAGPGWDACTGLGSVDGAQLLVALTGKAAAQAAKKGGRAA